MGKSDVLRRAGLLLGLAALTATGLPLPAAAVTFSAAGTHQCKAADGSTHTCVVSGSLFGDCISAGSSLQAQDCCPSSRVCSRDAQGRETNCRRGGTSTGFTLSYCIPSSP
jgi:hypothetical protein